MTINEFIDKLKDTPRDWYLYDGAIRRGPRTHHGCLCPMHALAPKMYSGASAGTSLGLSCEDADAIVMAADWRSSLLTWRSQVLRARLLEACGLEPKSGDAP